jgi:hypothetical protein
VCTELVAFGNGLNSNSCIYHSWIQLQPAAFVSSNGPIADGKAAKIGNSATAPFHEANRISTRMRLTRSKSKEKKMELNF